MALVGPPGDDGTLYVLVISKKINKKIRLKQNNWLPVEFTTARGTAIKWNNGENSDLLVCPVSSLGLVPWCRWSPERVIICEMVGYKNPAHGKTCFETLGLLTLPLCVEDMPAEWPLVLLQFCNTVTDCSTCFNLLSARGLAFSVREVLPSLTCSHLL